MTTDKLPDLVMEIIFSYLNQYDDLDNVRLVNRQWCRIACTVIRIFKKSFLRCNQMTWELQKTVENEDESIIAKRCSHASCYHDGSKKLYIFGGCTDNYTAFNDLWSFDLKSRKWSREFIKCAPFPRPKAMSIFVPYKEYLILHGGFSKSSPNPIHQAANFYNEMHMYDTKTSEWVEFETEPSPPMIASHCACVVDDFLVIFGGSHNSRATNSVYVLDIVSKTWHIPSIAKRSNLIAELSSHLLEPAPRYGSSCVLIDKSHLLVIGGCGGPNCIYNDAWLLKFDLTLCTAWEWKQVTITNPKSGPSQLWCHPACPVGQNLACISYAKKQNKYKAVSLDLCSAPFHITSRNPMRALPRSIITGSPSVSRSMNYQSSTNFGSLFLDFSSRQRGNGLLRCKKRPGTACVYVLNTAKVLEDQTVTWLQQDIDLNAPDDTMLYSLSAGRGELIMFGGMRSDMRDDGSNPFVHIITNDVYILRPFRSV